MYQKFDCLPKAFFTIALMLLIGACTQSNPDETVKLSAKTYEYHGLEYIDDYHWVREDNTSPTPSRLVKRIIEEKNEIADEFFNDNKRAINYVSNYMDQFNKIDKKSFPRVSSAHIINYEKEDETDSFHKIVVTKSNNEEVLLMLDVQSRAKESDTYEFIEFDISANGQTMAFTETRTGSFFHELYLTGSNLDTPYMIAKDVTDFVLTHDGRYVIYISDAYEMKIFDINAKVHSSIKVEDEENFTYQVIKSNTDGIVFLSSGNSLVTEVTLFDLRHDAIKETLVVGREKSLGISVDLINGKLYGAVYAGASNVLISIDIDDLSDIPDIAAWAKIFAPDEGAVITANLFYKNAFLLSTRQNGTDSLYVYDVGNQKIIKPKLPGDFHTIWLRDSMPSDTTNGIYRFWYESYLKPRTVAEFNLLSNEVSFKEVLKKGSSFDENNYIVKRENIESTGGVMVPATIVYHKDTPLDGSAPALLYGYGAYGNGVGAEFSSSSMALVEKGFIYTVAHVRGGNELGNQWYEDGMRLNKRNSFDDFINVAKYLIEKNYTSSGNISMRGESASGLVIGYALNNFADLFKSATVLVPFFDPLTAILDDSSPYAKYDINELGNAKESKEVFSYVKGYSPFGNLTAQPYPHTYVTGAIGDPSAGYWEPLKWTLKKESLNTGDSLDLIRVREGGHIANTAKKRKHEFTRQMAFVLWAHNVTSFAE